MHLVGFDLSTIEAGRTAGELPLSEQHRQQFGYVHGGVIATLCDVVAGFAAYSLVPPGRGVVTAELKVSYFRPGRGERLRAVGWVVKPGRQVHFCEAEVWALDGEQEVLIAKATTTMAVVVRPADG